MSYEMYAYHPASGIAICRKEDQWLLVEYFNQEGESQLISQKDSIKMANYYGLIDLPRKFETFSGLRGFLLNEYQASRARYLGAGTKELSSLELLDLLDREDVLGMIEEIRADGQKHRDPRAILGLMEAIEAHPKFESDQAVLGAMNPLKQTCKRTLGLPPFVDSGSTLADENANRSTFHRTYEHRSFLEDFRNAVGA